MVNVKAANTGKIGDGKITVSEITEVIRVRTGSQSQVCKEAHGTAVFGSARPYSSGGASSKYLNNAGHSQPSISKVGE